MSLVSSGDGAGEKRKGPLSRPADGFGLRLAASPQDLEDVAGLVVPPVTMKTGGNQGSNQTKLYFKKIVQNKMENSKIFQKIGGGV